MAHFAEIDKDNTVLRVIVVADKHEEDGENWCANLLGGTWKRTSYNTTYGSHSKGKSQFRKNYAGVGFKYDSDRDAFIKPKPDKNPSFVLNEDKCIYEPPIEKPATGSYSWDEGSLSWKSNG
jgi:hypothetical protein|tara:strand:- start:68 stop:433 length:366 start_codon:yes stop_codon:yes gene_type:complete